MKKIFAYLLTALLTYSGLWFAFVAEFNDNEPLAQGGQAVLAAVLFSLAILAAGWGNSLKRNGGRSNG